MYSQQLDRYFSNLVGTQNTVSVEVVVGILTSVTNFNWIVVVEMVEGTSTTYYLVIVQSAGAAD
jgi:hypothetical protein